MVKRTLVVLGILSLVLTAGTSFAFMGSGCWTDSCGPCKPMFVPAPCPDMCPQRAVKVWEMCIIGPCPPPACGVPYCGSGKKRWGGLMAMCGKIASPCEVLWGGSGGVYGCTSGRSGIHDGVFPAALAGLAQNCCCNYLLTGGAASFGCLW